MRKPSGSEAWKEGEKEDVEKNKPRRREEERK